MVITSSGCHGENKFDYFHVCLPLVVCLCLQVDDKKVELPELEGLIFLNIRR